MIMPFCASVTTGTVISGLLLSLFGTRPKVSAARQLRQRFIAVDHRLHQIGGVPAIVEILQRMLHRIAGLVAERLEVTTGEVGTAG